MSRAQPFRTTRPTGSPSAGGSTHTLAAHMASNSAHPQYVRKGDAVGDSNLTGHEADKNAHVRNYPRRSEIATEVDQYALSKGFRADDIHYSAESAEYRTLVSTYLLNKLFTDASAISSSFPSIALRTNIVTDFSGTTHLSGSGTENYDVPGWSIFNSLVGIVKDVFIGGKHSLATTHPFYSDIDDGTESARLSNPLSAIFATKGHTHGGYLTRDLIKAPTSIITFDDVRDPYNPGVIAARSDHTHSEYLTEDDISRLGVTFDPEVLRKVGIWETAVSTPKSIDSGTVVQSDSDLDKYATQGNYTFAISKVDIGNNSVDFVDNLHFPAKYINAIRGTLSSAGGFVATGDGAYVQTLSDSVKTEAILNVVSTLNPLIVFGETDFTSRLTSMTKGYTYFAASQRLYTDSPVKRLANSDVGGEDVSKLREYKDSVRGVYTRTGYSLESAWYISSVLNLIGHTPESFIDTTSEDNPVNSVASRVYGAMDSFVKSDSSLVEIGYYKFPHDVADTTVEDKFRLDPRFALLNGISNLRAMDLNWLLSSGVASSGKYTVSYMKNAALGKYSGTRDLSRWIMPGSMDKVNGIPATFSYDRLNRLDIIANSNNKVYLPYMQYYSSQATWNSVAVTTDGDISLDCTAKISLENDVYYYGSDHSVIEFPESDTTSAWQHVNVGTYVPDATVDYIGSDTNGYIAIVTDGTTTDRMSDILCEFTKVASGYLSAFTPDSKTVFAKKVKSNDPDTCANVFEIIPESNYQSADQDNVYVVRLVAERGVTPSIRTRGWMWSKHLVMRDGTEEWVAGRRYYKYDVIRHAFEDITTDLDSTMSLVTSAGIPADLQGFEFPIFEDINVVTLSATTARIYPVVGQYVAPKVSGNAILGVEYVRLTDSTEIDQSVFDEQDDNLSEAYTTGFVNEGSVRKQVAHIILDGVEASSIIVGDSVFTGAKVVSNYVTVVISTPVSVGNDAFEDDRQYVVSNSLYASGYQRLSDVTESTYASVKATYGNTLYYIEKDYELAEYLMPGEAFDESKVYCIKLPRYLELLNKKISAATPVYWKAFFYPTTDTAASTGKKYYKKSLVPGNFELVQSPVFDGSVKLYEIIDVDRFFDIWCAINQLVEDGSEHNTTYPANVKYTFGDNGELVAWNEWQQLVTDANTDFVDFITRIDKFKFALDTFLPDLYSAMNTAGYTYTTEANRKDGLGDLWNMVKWFNPASGALTQVTTDLLLKFSTETTQSTYYTRDSDGPKAAGAASRVAITTNTNKNDTRLKYGSSNTKLANYADLARKAGVEWVDSLEGRIEVLEGYDVAAIKTWLFGSATTAVPTASYSITTRLDDLELVYDWLKDVLPSGGSLNIVATASDKNIWDWISSSNPGDIVKLSSQITVGGNPKRIVDISENGYEPYQFSIVLKTADNGVDGAKVIDNPIAEVEIPGTGSVPKGAMHIPASSLLWVITTGSNHGVYFKVPNRWVNLYDIPANQDVEVYLRVRRYGSSSGSLNAALSRHVFTA